MLKFEIKDQLFSSELIENLSTKQGQAATDFGLPHGQRMSDEIARVFSMARNQWNNFQQIRQRLGEHQTGVSETRNLWMVPFFSLLGYELQYVRTETVGEASFQISHRDASKDGFPIDITSFRQSLDKNPDGNRGNRLSPHVQMQEYLNHTEHLYGFITNGLGIRLLRDHHRLTGIQYMEWDLEAIMIEDDLASFATLYRMLHVSRAPQNMGEDSYLETYHTDSVEEGHRVRNQLRSNVSQCLQALANGFLQQAENTELRALVENGEVGAEAYWQHLRKLVYRFLFLLVAEERGLVHQADTSTTAKQRYHDHYSLTRLRSLAESRRRLSHRFTDLWEQLKTTFSFFELEEIGEPLGIAPLGGDLFKPDALGPLKSAQLSNTLFLEAFDLLSRFKKEQRSIRINYRRINTEEFGAVYESLLDLHPQLHIGDHGIRFHCEEGMDRKSTGSYYTHKDLVEQLLKTALYPVMQERLKAVRAENPKSEPAQEALEKALLSIKVCDPACGSGHFLLAAARALATRLAQLRVKQGESYEPMMPGAMRDVIEHCIYGVDLNPDALELCRLVLWIEAHGAGKPITYLHHKIKCGNSLIGWLNPDEKPIIPPGAFKAVTGDNKKVTLLCKQRNAKESKGLRELDFSAEKPYIILQAAETAYATLAHLPSNSLSEIEQKEQRYQAWEALSETQREKQLYDAWAYAFFQPFQSEETAITQRWLEDLMANRIDPTHAHWQTIKNAAQEMRFFHWPLEFPDVFGRGAANRGFDVLLGNPPWERINLQEKEFFARRSPEIANASNASVRKRLIAALPQEGELYNDFIAEKRWAENQSTCLRESGQYALTASGDINTYSVFSERFLKLISRKGRTGLIVPTGIATDYGNRHFFSHLIQENKLVSLFDFENRYALFSAVHKSFKFSLITLTGTSNHEAATFSFFQHRVSDLSDPLRTFELSGDDFLRINPNTKTCPVFRTGVDASLSKSIYARFPVLINETERENFWHIQLEIMFGISSDSKLFLSKKQLMDEGSGKVGNLFIGANGLGFYPIYEAKLFWQYNHRMGSFDEANARTDGTRHSCTEELSRSNYSVDSWYWISEADIAERLRFKQKLKSGISGEFSWSIGFRKITSAINERTFVSAILPKAGYSDNCLLIRSNKSALRQSAFIANISSMSFDFICRLKLGGNNLNFFYVKQLPIIPPEQFSPKDLQFIVPRVLELSYTAWDLKAFADDVWAEADEALRTIILNRWQNNCDAIEIPEQETPDWVTHHIGEFPKTPFRWDIQYRLQIQCELDAYFAYKYGLEEEELKYILDPSTSLLAGATQEERDKFPGETFRVLKNKELKKYNEFRTYKLVMQAWKLKPWETPDAQALPTKKKQRSKPNYRLAKRMPLVMARIIHLHEQRPKYARTLGRTKMEKLLHLIEAEAGIDLGRVPIKDQYGPADAPLREQQEENARQLQYFDTVKEEKAQRGADGKKQYRYRYYRMEDFSTSLEVFSEQFAQQTELIDQLVNLFLNLSNRETELIITLYAEWNNHLLSNTPIDSETALLEAACRWSPAKLENYQPKDFKLPMQWLKEHGLVPVGKGKVVESL